MKRQTKILSSLFLAGSLVFSSSVAFAAETDKSVPDAPDENETIAEQPLVENEINEDANVVEEPTVESDQQEEAPLVEGEQRETNNEQTDTSVNEEQIEEEQEVADNVPSLVPGDFFYFLKIVLEKVQLALTFEEEKEAKLLAEFAAERLAEAEVLFSNGEENKALELIQKAISDVDKSSEIIDNPDAVIEEEDPADEAEMKQEEKESALEETVTEEKTETAEEAEEDKTSQSENEQVKVLISQNIIALTAAMEKVKNPTAKAALQKNIEKSYKKLEKKIAKWEKKYGEIEGFLKENDNRIMNDVPAKSDKEEVQTTAEETTNTNETQPLQPEADKEKIVEANNTVPVVENEMEIQTKQHVKEVKAIEKVERKLEKEQQKTERKNEKELQKLEKKVEKEQQKVEKKLEKEQQKNEKAAAKQNGPKGPKENKGKDKE